MHYQPNSRAHTHDKRPRLYHNRLFPDNRLFTARRREYAVRMKKSDYSPCKNLCLRPFDTYQVRIIAWLPLMGKPAATRALPIWRRRCYVAELAKQITKYYRLSTRGALLDSRSDVYLAFGIGVDLCIKAFLQFDAFFSG
jgi:hypothetical protein